MTDTAKTGNETPNENPVDNADVENKDTTSQEENKDSDLNKDGAPEEGKTISQEEFNKIVSKRVQLEADKQAKIWQEKFADYEALKEKAKKAEEIEGKLNDITNEYKSVSAERDKLKVAREFDLDEKGVSLLQGNDYDELKASAENLKSFLEGNLSKAQEQARNLLYKGKEYGGNNKKEETTSSLMVKKAMAEARNNNAF